MDNPFKPYLKLGSYCKTQILVPARVVNDIKKQQKFWYCKKCDKPVIGRNTEHCNTSLMCELEIFGIEKLGLHEISEGEVRKMSEFSNRMQLINFIEMNYGWIKCNEQLLLILIKQNT